MEKGFEKYRAEYWGVNRARELHLPLDKVHVHPIGSFKRGTDDDIISETLPDEDAEGHLTLTVTRSTVLSTAGDAEITEFLNSVEMEEGDIEDNRDRVSLPLDVRFNNFRLLIEAFEQEPTLAGVGFLALADEGETARSLDMVRESLIPEVPQLYKVAGVYPAIERILNQAIEADTRLIKKTSPESSCRFRVNGFPYRLVLGSMRLGIDLLVDQSALLGHEVEIRVRVPIQRLDEFLDGGHGLRKIESVCSYLLPVDCTPVVFLESSGAEFLLSDELSDGRLGYSSTLSSNQL